MNNGFLFLVVGELIVIAFIIAAKWYINKQEQKKIDKVINFIDKRSKSANKGANDKFIECIEIIKKNKEIDNNERSRN